MELSITVIIIIITSLLSIGGFSNQRIIDDLIFYPPGITHRKQWYRFFSCGLIHADFGHLIFNMLSLYLFGRFVEEKFTQIFADNGKSYALNFSLKGFAAAHDDMVTQARAKAKKPADSPAAKP